MEMSDQLHALITLLPGKVAVVPIEDLRAIMDAFDMKHL
jgi:hypothetical protein